MRLPEFLVDHPDGEIRLTGHRISLYNLVTLYQAGSTFEGLCEQFPSLSSSLIRDVIDYYRKNQPEVDRYVADYRAELERQRSNAPGVGPSLGEMRRRMEAMRREEVR